MNILKQIFVACLFLCLSCAKQDGHVSLFSRWKKPAVKLPWNKAVFEDDLKTYGEYTVKTIADGLISVNGERTDAAWDNCENISSFVNPWSTSVFPETSLRMLKDSRQLYFLFDVKDDELLLESEFSHERDVEKEDRVELFFSKDKDMNDYYGFEMDALGRILSYRAEYYRRFDFEWEPVAGMIVASKISPDGRYSVEGAIPLEFMKDFIQSDGSVYMGAYRAEFSKKDSVTVENWLTWINPQTVNPDFHVPSSLGKLSGFNHKH